MGTWHSNALCPCSMHMLTLLGLGQWVKSGSRALERIEGPNKPVLYTVQQLVPGLSTYWTHVHHAVRLSSHAAIFTCIFAGHALHGACRWQLPHTCPQDKCSKLSWGWPR